MSKKIWLIILVTIAAILVVTYAYWLISKQLTPRSFSIGNQIKSGPLVGGDKDAHGCIGSAGYGWCEAKGKCLRSWEEYCGTAKLDPIFMFLESIREQGQAEYEYVTDASFEWTVKGLRPLVEGLQLVAKNVTDKEYKNIQAIFVNNGFKPDVANQVDGPTGNVFGYVRNNWVCILDRKFTDIKKGGEVVAINVEKQEIKIYCGLKEY